MDAPTLATEAALNDPACAAAIGARTSAVALERSAAKRCPVVLMARALTIGGSERQVVEVARSLDRTWFEPIVACFDASGVRGDDLRAAGIPVVEFPVRSFRSAAAVAQAWAFVRWLRRLQVRVVHPFDVPTVLFAVPLARAARVPVVLSSQRGDRRLFSRASRHALGLMDRLADGIVVNSEYIRRVLVSEFGLDNQRIRTCPNAVDTTRFRPDGPSHRGEFADARLVVGAVTVLRPEKSIQTIIEAFARLQDQRLRLVIVGDGPCKADLQALADRLGLAARCTFVPATSDVAPWYRTIDVFVLSSSNESFSNALMEAMACGCAVVASNVGGNPELVRHAETGRLFEAGNAVDLAQQLEAVIDDPVGHARLGAAAVAELRERYSIERSTGRFAALYREMLDR